MTRQWSVFSLTLFIVGSVDSIRNLPAAALLSGDIYYYFFLALFLFLIPTACIASWFSYRYTEGIYGWVKNSLGENCAFYAAWFQWMQNIFIFPTFLSFTAGVFLYCLSPEHSTNKIVLFTLINLIIWGLTYINLKGLSLSRAVSIVCALLGLIVPFVLILGIGLVEYIREPHALAFTANVHERSWTSFTAVMLSFCGIEIVGIYSIRTQSTKLPKAIGLAVIIIFVTMLLGSLTIGMFVPYERLNFITNIPEVFELFFTKIHLNFLAAWFTLLIGIGCIGCANNWLTAPVSTLSFALQIGKPKKLLLIQSSIISVISTLFLLVSSINTSYWIMLTLATQMYLSMYLLMFIGAIKLALRSKNSTDCLIIGIASVGIMGVLIAISVSFYPPFFVTTTHLMYIVSLGVSLFVINGVGLMLRRGLNLLPE